MNKIKLLLVFMLLSSCIAQVPQYSKRASEKKQQRTLNTNPSVKIKYDQADSRILKYLKKSHMVNIKRRRDLNKERSGRIESCYV
jgi:hypothetical protein